MTDDIRVDGLTIDYGKVRAVDGVSFGVAPGELVTLLGPSGCGKTSTLRAIAGLERNSGGTVSIAGTLVSDAALHTFVAPERRNIGMVFQSYALWPHMTVAEAVAYPLQRRKIPKGEHADRVMKTLTSVGMETFAHRRVPELSGGQQQRVAIARALVYEPRVLLLDEPLSNLDARLRERMRVEIKDLQSRLGITTLCVTHDQAEAMAMSHRIIVMQAGSIEQIGTPEEVYASPRTRFAGESLGKVNILPCRVTLRDRNGSARDRVVAVLDDGGTAVEASTVHEAVRAGEPASLIIRPERVELHVERPEGGNTFEGAIRSYIFAGDHREYSVAVGPLEMLVNGDARSSLGIGDRVFLRLPPGDLTAVE